MTTVDDMDEALEYHNWRGGYYCECGHPLNSAAGWARHLARIIDQINGAA